MRLSFIFSLLSGWGFETGSQHSPGRSGTHYADKAGLEPQEIDTQNAGVKACAVRPGLVSLFFYLTDSEREKNNSAQGSHTSFDCQYTPVWAGSYCHHNPHPVLSEGLSFPTA